MQTLAFWLLGLAVLAVWLPPPSFAERRFAAWPVLYLAAVSVALVAGVVELRAAAVIGVLALLCFGGGRSLRPVWRSTAMVAAAVVAVAMSMHVIPGFHNPKLFDAVAISTNAPPFTQYLNFDKATAGLFLLAAFAPRLGSRLEAGRRRSGIRQTLAIAAVSSVSTVVVVFGIAGALGGVGFDAKLPPNTWAFLATNLLFTCVAEEAFFRGLLQERLASACTSPTLGMVLPVVVSALLFGLVHAPGGVTLAVVAGVAGIGYGIAYQATGRIEAAILTHFGVNAMHFLFFTYPYANA